MWGGVGWGKPLPRCAHGENKKPRALAVSFATFFNFFLFMNERGSRSAATSTTDPSGEVLSYPPSNLVFAWGWGDADQVLAVSVGSTVFFVTIVICQVCRASVPFLHFLLRLSPLCLCSSRTT